MIKSHNQSLNKVTLSGVVQGFKTVFVLFLASVITDFHYNQFS